MVGFILDQHVLNISMTDIMHMLFFQNVKNFSGYKEESFKGIPPDILLMLGESTPRMIRNMATKNLKDHPLQKIRNDHVKSRGVIHSYFLKGEPSDTQSILKPKQSQGKALESQKRMKADFLYLGSGYIVLRSKTCQEGGDVVALKSVVQPESHQTYQTDHLGGTIDRGPVQGVYLYNQKDFQYETNFIGLYTQEVVHSNWNQGKIFTEKEVMNFTSQRFLSLSICEYPTLEEDSSPMKKRPEAKPIIGVKRSLSAFQKDKDQEKCPRNYELAGSISFKPEIGDQEIISTNQETSYTDNRSSTSPYLAPANIGSKGSSLTPTCLIWKLLHSNSNSSFSLSLCTTSEPSKPSRRSQGISLIPLNHPGSRKIRFFTWSQNSRKGSND
ncbi:hypothetical protein YC2023_033102 [Brassica napus]